MFVEPIAGKFKRVAASSDRWTRPPLSDSKRSVLLILLPTAWLAVVTFFVVICQMAARGDATIRPAVPPTDGRMLRSGVRVWEDGPVLHAHDHASHVFRRLAAARNTRTARRASGAHGRRSRSHAGS
jgi:hypothetical protein